MKFAAFLVPLAASAIALSTTAASAAITVTKAEISAGKLVVQGSRSGTAATISLDGTFSTGVVGNTFAFSLDHVPPDCIVDLAAVGGTGRTAKAMIASCGPKGLNPRARGAVLQTT